MLRRIRLGTLRKIIREEAWVPGRWLPGTGEPVPPEDAERLGDPLGGAAADDEDEENDDALKREIREFLAQEGPPGASLVDPREPQGAYPPFDPVKDRMGTDDPFSTWYRSPGRQPGTEGDPYRSDDPSAQLGLRSPATKEAGGEEGTEA
jgi:hypothetical protein